MREGCREEDESGTGPSSLRDGADHLSRGVRQLWSDWLLLFPPSGSERWKAISLRGVNLLCSQTAWL